MINSRIPLLFAALASVAASNPKVPKFEDHLVPIARIGSRASPIMTEATRHIADQVRKAIRAKPDFAGHYVMLFDSCGASCAAAGALDLRTGRTIWLPFTVCCANEDVKEPIDYRAFSTLVVIRGSRNEKGYGTYYYNFDGRRFNLLFRQIRPE